MISGAVSDCAIAKLDEQKETTPNANDVRKALIMGVFSELVAADPDKADSNYWSEAGSPEIVLINSALEPEGVTLEQVELDALWEEFTA